MLLHLLIHDYQTILRSDKVIPIKMLDVILPDGIWNQKQVVTVQNYIDDMVHQLGLVKLSGDIPFTYKMSMATGGPFFFPYQPLQNLFTGENSILREDSVLHLYRFITDTITPR